MKIEIDVPRPFLTLAIVGAIGWGLYNSLQGGGLAADLTGGAASSLPYAAEPAGATSSDYGAAVAEAVGGQNSSALSSRARPPTQAELDVLRGRAEQEMLQRKVEILRGQLKVLDAERASMGDEVDPTLALQFQNASRILQSLLQDQQRADEFMLAALGQIWEAQQHAIALGANPPQGVARVALAWPVQPTLGISAGFHDPAYEDRFGFAHDAVDIPVLQGTDVRAAADGTVEETADHGLGFSYVTVKHADGTVTLYGHLTTFSVLRGAVVKAGDVLGLSGGRPGTPGAGLSTGPHLHFGVFRDGAAIDPMGELPPFSSFIGTQKPAAQSSSSSVPKAVLQQGAGVPVLKIGE
ncbi:MAG: M23 family metallopeptidase [Candidatus Peribacteraceae bacterium]|jgi:murein DD-endopeptidase MepM/ murein hydrolase activator NlpD